MAGVSYPARIWCFNNRGFLVGHEPLMAPKPDVEPTDARPVRVRDKTFWPTKENLRFEASTTDLAQEFTMYGDRFLLVSGVASGGLGGFTLDGIEILVSLAKGMSPTDTYHAIQRAVGAATREPGRRYRAHSCGSWYAPEILRTEISPPDAPRTMEIGATGARRPRRAVDAQEAPPPPPPRIWTQEHGRDLGDVLIEISLRGG